MWNIKTLHIYPFSRLEYVPFLILSSGTIIII